MTFYHAVLIDETGCEFGADCHASDRDAAYEYFHQNYPESQVVQLEDPNDTAAREYETYARVCRIYDDGEDGRYDRDY